MTRARASHPVGSSARRSLFLLVFFYAPGSVRRGPEDGPDLTEEDTQTYGSRLRVAGEDSREKLFVLEGEVHKWTFDYEEAARQLGLVMAFSAIMRDHFVRCVPLCLTPVAVWSARRLRQVQRYVRSARDAETMAYTAYLHAVDRPGVIATAPVAGLLYDAGIGLPRQPEGGAV